MKKMKILMADHDSVFAEKVASEISDQRDMELIGICTDGRSALSMTYEKSPDLLIMDLLLPVIDGFGVIESLYASGEPPELLVLSGLTSSDIIQHINQLSISNFLMKPINPDIIVSRIRDILFGYYIFRSILSNDGTVNPWSAILNRVSGTGILPHMKGFHFICDAVAYMLDSLDDDISMTKHLYPAIAAKHKTSPMTVERAIRMAITKTWSLGIIEESDPLFGYTIKTHRGRPTNQEFLRTVTIAVREDCDMP